MQEEPAIVNFIKPHEGMGDRTPAEAAGIDVQGAGKWRTLIQNAAVTAWRCGDTRHIVRHSRHWQVRARIRRLEAAANVLDGILSTRSAHADGIARKISTKRIRAACHLGRAAAMI